MDNDNYLKDDFKRGVANLGVGAAGGATLAAILYSLGTNARQNLGPAIGTGAAIGGIAGLITNN